MGKGTIFIDNTTASAEVARELAEIGKEKGIGFIDAPVSGGQAGAENGVLTVMCGGDTAVFDRAEPVIDCYARAVTLLGPVGSRSAERRLGKECVRTCRSRGSPSHKNKNDNSNYTKYIN